MLELANDSFTHAGGQAEHIMIVLHDFSGGGTERVAIRLANEWARFGRTVRIFCGSEAGPLRALVDGDVSVVRANPALPRGRFSRIRLGFALARAAEIFRPDLVFAPGNFHLLVLAAFASRDTSGAATMCKISNPLGRAGQPWPSRAGQRLAWGTLSTRIDMFVAMSPALRAEAAAVVDPARITALWEPTFDAGFADGTGGARDPALIVAAGRLEPQKNFALAIEAMAHLCRWSDAKLVILGDGSERARLAAQAAALGLDQRIAMPGHVADIKPWLNRASCFLMTSHYEGYPASLLEALACGLPAIVTPCSPALGEMLPPGGLGGVIASDAGAIANALQAVLRRRERWPVDRALLARHDLTQAAQSYLELMDRVRCVRPAKSPSRTLESRLR